ncbi:mechanosensitive ion channel domain-containing protein [Parvibaculum sp.]|uniref:mechanosensitive ion channel family protein n=1 Tax=Parvibaculum sp. TaxID=2024848 RepID=UPI0032113AE6
MMEWLPTSIQHNLDAMLPVFIDHGLSFIGAVIILILGYWFSGKARQWVSFVLGRAPNGDAMLQSFFGSVASYSVMIFTILAVLAQFGVQTTSFIALLGAAGLAVGLALQGTLSNVAAGVMLLFFRPFRAGNYVEVGGIAGTVKHLTLFTTELTTVDNVQIIVPNSSVWGQAVKNYSYHSTRRLDLIFSISYDDNIARTIEVMRDVMRAEKRVLDTPEPLIAVNALNQSSVDMLLRVWVGNDDYWPVKFDLTRAMKERFDTEGITIPFPTQTVHNLGDPQPAATSQPRPGN